MRARLAVDAILYGLLGRSGEELVTVTKDRFEQMSRTTFAGQLDIDGTEAPETAVAVLRYARANPDIVEVQVAWTELAEPVELPFDQ